MNITTFCSIQAKPGPKDMPWSGHEALRQPLYWKWMCLEATMSTSELRWQLSSMG